MPPSPSRPEDFSPPTAMKPVSATPDQGREPQEPLRQLNDAPALKTWNCLNCRKRKIRCDRRDPCAHCTKSALHCSFPVTGRVPTRRPSNAAHKPEEAGWKARQATLLKKLSQLEDVVSRLQTGEEEKGDMGELGWCNEGLGTLVAATTGRLYVDNGFWAALCNEAKDLYLDGEKNGRTTNNSGPLLFPFATIPHNHSVFAMDDQIVREQEWLPLPSQIPWIWQTFLINADPCIKVLHTPTMSAFISESGGKISSMDPVMKGLICAIVLATIESLDEEEVVENFGHKKSWLIPNISHTVEKTLSQAGFLTTSDLRVLQAIVIYLDCLGQQHGDRTVWALTGLLTRTAVSIGLHRDGSLFSDISPFETEMRRRLWWHICFIDLRFGDAQAIDMAISERLFDSREPTNVNDEDIYPEMKEAPVARESFTDLSFTILRCEIWRVSRRIHAYISMSICPNKKNSLQEELAMLQQTIRRLEDRVLRHLDIEKPFHRLIDTIARINFARGELLLTHKSHFGAHTDSTSLSSSQQDLEQDSTFMVALLSIEWAHQSQQLMVTRRWSWILRACPSWDSLAVVIVRLLWVKGAWTDLCERAWQTVVLEMDSIPETLKSEPIRQPMWVVMDAVRRRRKEFVSAVREVDEAGGVPVSEGTRMDVPEDFSEFLWDFDAPFQSEGDFPGYLQQ